MPVQEADGEEDEEKENQRIVTSCLLIRCDGRLLWPPVFISGKTTMLPRSTILAIAVAALGYFVDVFDLILFSVVRVPSLQSLGLAGDELLSTGILLLNVQMTGLLIGGIIWGIWGDKRGRVSVLFGSILFYSIANLLNGFVSTVPQYAVLRFIAGIGLAGELGAGITLVSESMPKETRGYATTVVATVGVAGALLAAFVGEWYDWRTAYIIGGVLGLCLLVARIAVHESGLFERSYASDAKKGDFLALFRSPAVAKRYVSCILVGLPIWYVVGILITLSPEFGVALAMPELPKAGKAIFYCYIGLVVGDVVSGLLSQFLKSRKYAIGIFLAITTVGCALYLSMRGVSLFHFHVMCIVLGFGVGYWAVFVTTAAEQFGTNLRATVATTVPNFVRGALVPLSLLFEALRNKAGLTVLQSGAFVGVLALVAAFVAVVSLRESFGNDLDYLEQLP